MASVHDDNSSSLDCQRLNPKFFIQPSETLPVELTKTQFTRKAFETFE